MLLVVRARPPDPAAADPAVRLLGRVVRDLAGRGVPVTLATEEPAAAGAATLAAAGVALAPVVDPTADLPALVADARAVVATDPGGPLSRSAARAAADAGIPLLVATDVPWSAALAATADRPDGRHLEGLDQLVGVLAADERAVLAAADVVLALGDAGADAVRTLDPAADVRTLRAPTVPWPATAATLPWRRRRGLVVPGRWHTEPGAPDEDGLRALADRLEHRPDARRWATPIAVAGLDGPGRLLEAARRLRAAADDRSWDAVRSRARVAALPRRFGHAQPLVVDDLVAAGLPFAATATAVAGLALGPAGPLVRCGDLDELVDRLAALAGDHRTWVEAVDALAALAEAGADRPDPVDVVAEALAALGVPGARSTTAPTAPTAVDELATAGTALLPRPPGTLAAGHEAAEAHERRMGLGWTIDRDDALQIEGMVEPWKTYRLWRAVHEETADELDRLRADPPPTGWAPTVSLLVPCWRTPPELLVALIASVQGQVYRHWELVLVDDASDDPALTAALEQAAADDRRIVVVALAENRGIAGATQAAFEAATGELVGLLDHDDELHPMALQLVVERFDAEPDLDVVHTDEDKLTEDGVRDEPAFKPDWNPDLLDGVNYANHLTVVRRALVEAVGGWRPAFDGSQDHDLWLRLAAVTDRIGHVARPLYHWRKVEGSTAAVADVKGGAGDAGRRAIAEAVERRGGDAEVGDGLIATWHRVRYRAPATPLVSIIVPTRNGGDLVATCLERLEATVDYPSWELVLVDNGSDEPESVRLFAELADRPDVRVVRYDHQFHFARQIDLGAAAARGSLLLVLNNDTVAHEPGWFEELVAQALRPEVGPVGLRLMVDDETTQHEGIVLGVGGVAWNLKAGHHAVWNRNVRDAAGVTAAALMVRTEVFRAVGGFDEMLRVAYNDVDLCLRLGAMGWRNVYTPWAELFHAESASRGSLHPMEDEDHYIARWGGPMALRDPLWNVNLDIIEGDYLRV